jgi:spore maturation protein CgeB
MFVHSLVSDWNHGNAHFLRGVVSELLARGHDVQVYEPENGWSLRNLLEQHGDLPVRRFNLAYPKLSSISYNPRRYNVKRMLDGTDLCIVHEWNDPQLVQRIGRYRARRRSLRLLFHDTHHRSVTARDAMLAYDLTHYDGVLAFGRVIRDHYLREGWTRRAWTWHEAADTRVFKPMNGVKRSGDLVWIGNWGDEERSAELHEFLIKPVRDLGLKARVYGVRYPEEGVAAMAEAGIDYAGWLPNYEVPKTFSKFRVTVHVPRRPYVAVLPGIPTIRPFEALACGIPLVSAPWHDMEGLFTPGEDFLVARNGAQMKRHLRALLAEPEMARDLAARGRRTILARHTCGHRVDELMAICAELGMDLKPETSALQPALEVSSDA